MTNKIFSLLILVGMVFSLISCGSISNTNKLTSDGKTQEPAHKSILFYDDFSKEQSTWAMGEFQGEFADINYQLVSGVYLWTVNSHDIANERTWPEMDPVSDFIATVDAHQKSNNLDECDYGLIFRDPTDKSLLSFTVSNQQFSVYSYSPEESWVEVIPWTDSNAITPAEFNHLKVVSSNGEYVFSVNDQELRRFNYSEITKGQLGLNIDVFPADTTCVFEFDNFQVTLP